MRPWLTIAEACAPDAKSANSVCTSRARVSFPLTWYELPMPRSMRRTTSSSGCTWNGGGATPAVSSSVSVTSAMLRAGRAVVPAKMTSSISPPRRLRAEFSPIAQRSASTTFDLPQPFGPTIPVRPGRISTLAGSAKLLNPAMRRREKLTGKWVLPGEPGCRTGRRSGVRDELAEGRVVHFAGVLLAVDHEGRSRVDVPPRGVGLLPGEDGVAQRRVGHRRVERGA